MSVSQYAKHAGLSRQALYNWEAKQGFPARVDGKIDQLACDAYLARYRSSSDPRTKNAKSKPISAREVKSMGREPVDMSVTEIKRIMAGDANKAAGMVLEEHAQLAAQAVGLFLSKGPNNPLSHLVVTACRLLKRQIMKLGRSLLVVRSACLLTM